MVLAVALRFGLLSAGIIVLWHRVGGGAPMCQHGLENEQEPWAKYPWRYWHASGVVFLKNFYKPTNMSQARVRCLTRLWRTDILTVR